MDKNVVGWFEIPVTDMERAKKFYSAVFKVAIDDFPMPELEMATFPMDPNSNAVSGALVKGEGYVPSSTGSVLYFSCEDVANELSRVEAAGGQILVPKTSLGEHGNMAHVLDTEGNRIALHCNS
jgi:predicted enzyme related to lactoylglutathione lyase